MIGKWRDIANRHTGAVSAVAVVVIVGSLVWMFRGGDTRPGPTGQDRVWFYDLNTGELFTAPRLSIPPIDTPSGPHVLPDGRQMQAGVRAYVFHCAGRDGPASWFIGYLEMYDEDARRLMLANQGRGEPAGEPSPELTKLTEPGGRGRLIRAGAGGEWVVADSGAGAKVSAALRDGCANAADVTPNNPDQASGDVRYWRDPAGGPGFVRVGGR